MPRPLLTVLTAPVPTARERFYRGMRAAARSVVKPGRPRPSTAQYPGHEALVRSVVIGLRKIGADFNFNPARLRDVGRVVYAPANEALRQAAELERDGRITGLVAGPVNALLPHQSGGILLMPAIDTIIVPSQWVYDLNASLAPQIAHKLRVCPAGVDLDEWVPGNARGDGALVYWKHGPETFCEDVERTVARAGLRSIRIRYGFYDRAAFERALRDSTLAVFLSDFETQGLALAEAWAMNVPTAVWDPRGPAEWDGDSFTAGSSCPYLTPATGRAWQSLAEFESVLEEMIRLRHTFQPRAWVAEHMSDQVCAAALYAIIQQTERGR